MPFLATQGAASARGFGLTTSLADRFFIEDVFSTFLYTGNGTSKTITNGIDLAGKGGLVWQKSREDVGFNHILFDTVTGVNKNLWSNAINAQSTVTGNSVLSNGFVTGTNAGYTNENNYAFASWTFRKQAKFFDVVTYTGNGANRTIAHNLGSVPGSIWVKRTDTTGAWQCYHRSLANTEYLVLNTTAAKATGATRWNSTTPTSTEFSLGTDSTVNADTGTYVAYIFAHDAGGFGTAGTDNVISCGSYTGNGSATGPVINLGYEPQYVLQKRVDSTSNWHVQDIMRGMPVIGNTALLLPNDAGAEYGDIGLYLSPNATGFQIRNSDVGYNADGGTYIYIAIRRGPMKTPTSGTSVFGLNARSGTGANTTVTGSAGVSDAVLVKNRGSAVASLFAARLTGTGYLVTSATAAEVAAATTILQTNPWDVMDGVKVGDTSTITNATSNTYINYLFDRAPGFFDVVCYAGNSTAGATQAHNLGAVPELMLVKARNGGNGFTVYSAATGNNKYLFMYNRDDGALTSSTQWNNTTPTSSVFSLGTDSNVNNSIRIYIAYLFATLAGVSKVGSYTGTAAAQTINCGFTAGARFVLIRRTDAGGDWFVWDSTRGIVSGDDPYLLLNDTAAEVTNTDYIDPVNSGFQISSTAPDAINADGGTFIFLAIA